MPNFVVADGLKEMYEKPLNEERHEIKDVAPDFHISIPVFKDKELPLEDEESQPAVQMEHPFEWKPFYWAYVAVGALVLYVLLKK